MRKLIILVLVIITQSIMADQDMIKELIDISDSIEIGLSEIETRLDKLEVGLSESETLINDFEKLLNDYRAENKTRINNLETAKNWLTIGIIATIIVAIAETVIIFLK